MVLKTKCIFDPRSYTDGTRISIMSKHTLDDGKTLDERIAMHDDRFFWLRDVAPPQKLVGTYYEKLNANHDKDFVWKFYESNYSSFLNSGEPLWYVKQIADCATREIVTILSKEIDYLRSDRRIFADACKKAVPQLEIAHVPSRDAPTPTVRL